MNQGAVEQVGYSREELIGMTMLHIAPDFTDAKLRALLEPLERGAISSTTFTTVHRHRDGTDLPVEITLEARRDEDGRPESYVKIVRDISERLEVDQRLRQAELVLSVANDRDRIARDLHDRTIQRLFAAGLALQSVQLLCDEVVAGRVGAVVDDLDDTIRELRSVIFALQTRELDSGLRSQLMRVIAAEGEALGFEPQVRFDGLVDSVDPRIASELLATAREALSNVARHAQASSVQVLLACHDDVVLRVVDDGRGIPEHVVAGRGTGNMAARASMLGGGCRLDPRPEGGTVLEWTVPNVH